MLRFALALCPLLALFTSSVAEAYTARTTESGIPIRWRSDTVRVVVDPSLAAIAPSPETWVADAFATWEQAEGALPPGVIVEPGAVDEIGFHRETENLCTVRYLPGGAPMAGQALAVTVVTFDDGGTILDADIVINGGSDRPFARVGGAGGAFDIDSVLTHEIGHFYGLGESEDHPEATMFPQTARGEINKRDLADDDVAGLQSLYPVAFGGACSMGGGAPGGSAVIALLCAMGLLRRRRR